MNFDDLKNEWNAENPEESNISSDMLKIKQARTPVDKIRSKMKHEFFYQLFFLLFMAFIPYIFGFSALINRVFLMSYSITCGFTAYYFFKFYIFYKNSYDLSMDTRKNILWFYYEMKLNIELYKALTYIVAFISVCFLTAFVFIEKASVFSRILNKLSPVYILLNCFVTILIIGAITELWAWFYYGKYLKEVKKLIDELDYE
jgi:hypothetical protein